MSWQQALIVIVFAFQGLSLAYAQFQITEDDTGFEISFNGLKVLEHLSERPLLELGNGEFEAVFHKGDYDINDTINERFPLPNWTIDQEASGPLTVTLTNEDGLGMKINLDEDSISKNQFSLVFDYDAFDNEGINRYFFRLPSTPEEAVWGGGEQYTWLNMRGRTYPMWVREQGFGRNKSSLLTQIVDEFAKAGGDFHTTYWPQASFLSSRKYYVELTTPTYSELQFSPEGDDEVGHYIYWHWTPVKGEPCRSCKMNFLVGGSLMDIVQELNPGQPPLPDWIHDGAILGVQGGTEDMLGYLRQAQDAGAKINGLWIQDWSGKIVTALGTRVFWNWRWNETWYPNLDTVIQDLKEENVRVLVYITPHLNVEGDVYESLSNENIWLNRKDSSRLVQDFGQFNVTTVDIVNPDPDCNCLNPARIMYKDLMKKNILDLGIAGWMADFGEYTEVDVRTAYPGKWWSDEDHGEILHQNFAQEWCSLNRELVEENGVSDEIMFFMRAGGLRSKYSISMGWSGDQNVDWTQSDGLKSSIVSSLSLSLGGMGLSHSDIGGYTGMPPLGEIRSKELLLRWAEYSAFTPVMRTHEGSHRTFNHQVYTDEDTMTQFARTTQIFAALKEYSKATVLQNANEFTPVMRPLFLEFDTDGDAYHEDYQYMYGDDLLVAPVTEPGMTEWEVYLPGPQDWIYLWDDEATIVLGPKRVIVPAPMGQTPVFYKADSKWVTLFQEINRQFSFSNSL
ncbi:hypothetical protein TCAL_05612 [Tigriopus californicus]|uniref:Glycoside hydrolase family 31 N-terminal domain-containing protein n=1 Tax=Tigriopus californicus TaxID=6832 RepID=A0A553NUR8_TIGCA|nr:sulfoquinovosidase-like [Tigriopus californicus]TRY69177.1 hypothetical protein TCAL_05612 [Tigriopus californicus]